jgi:hypothetical protein
MEAAARFEQALDGSVVTERATETRTLAMA